MPTRRSGRRRRSVRRPRCDRHPRPADRPARSAWCSSPRAVAGRDAREPAGNPPTRRRCQAVRRSVGTGRRPARRGRARTHRHGSTAVPGCLRRCLPGGKGGPYPGRQRQNLNAVVTTRAKTQPLQNRKCPSVQASAREDTSDPTQLRVDVGCGPTGHEGHYARLVTITE